MERKWYQDWRSWIAMILLFFAPTTLIGIIFMWCCTPWSKKAKAWITGVIIGIPVAGILLSAILLTFKPKKATNSADDYKRRADIQEITNAAFKFCIDNGKCPATLLELKQAGYLKEIPTDPKTKKEYLYEPLRETGTGRVYNCTIKAILNDGTSFSRSCVSQ
jgi:hypothetical protein